MIYDLTPYAQELRAQVWAMHPSEVNALLSMVSSLPFVGERFEDVKYEAKKLQVENGVAKIPVQGPLMKSVPIWVRAFGIKMTGYAEITEQIQLAVSDPSVKEIQLCVDSPGGTVGGVEIASAAIRHARNQKPITALVDGMCTSGAYWLAAQANEIKSTATSLIGSIGVYSVMEDISEMQKKAGIKTLVFRSGPLKGAGILGDIITEDQISVENELVSAVANMFIDEVAKGRNVQATKVVGWASGRVWLASEALGLGLIDGVTSSQIEGNTSVKKKLRAEVPTEEEELEEEQVEETPAEEDLNEEDKTAVEETPVEEEKPEGEDEMVEGEGGEEGEEEEDMEEGVVKAAAISDLEAEFPDHPKFVIECIKNKYSMIEAKAAFLDVVRQNMKKTKGTKPVGFAASQPGSKNFWALVDEQKKQGKSMIDAMRFVKNQNPGIEVPMNRKG